MERVAAAELVAKLWACSIGRRSVLIGIPDLVVGGEDFLSGVEIDRLKQPRAKDVWRLVFFRRVEGRGASNGDAFGLCHCGGGALVLLLIGILGLVVFTDSE